jgi:trans-2,3-dihydro-3-hydroxyanthranilate isomerase
VFVLPPADPRHKAAVRIFTSRTEMVFAGHPTIGSAVLLALRDGLGTPEAFGLEEKIGVVSCIAEATGEREGYARFRVPQLPTKVGPGYTPAVAAAILGLAPDEIGFAAHVCATRTAGPTFEMVPVANEAALARAKPSGDFDRYGGSGMVYVYTGARSGLRARLFAPATGTPEHPATGSAAACLAGALAEHEALGDGAYEFIIEQGLEMGRPSRIELQIMLENGALAGVELGGRAVLVAEGVLYA